MKVKGNFRVPDTDSKRRPTDGDQDMQNQTVPTILT